MKQKGLMKMKSRELTPEFRKEFVMKIGGAKGKDAVLYNGLLALAHEEPTFGHIRAFMTQYPSPENKFTAFARAEIYNKDGMMIGMEEADASAANCGKMTAASFPRMALTRAKGRAFRDFLNVGMVTSDEISSAGVYEPELATAKQIGLIKRLSKKKGVKKRKLMDIMYKETGTEFINDLTILEADDVVKLLQDLADKEEEMDFGADDE